LKQVYTRQKFILLVIPEFALYTLFTIVPVFGALYYSLTNFRGFGKYNFVGFQNYIMVFKDRFFYTGLQNTFIITMVSTVVGIVLSFILAFLINKRGIKNDIYKTIFFAPNTLSGIVVGLMWSFMLDPVNGFFNIFLRTIGMENLALEWIGGRVLTPWTVGVISNWAGVGFGMVIWLAGLKAIPEEVIESAVMDGATKFQQIIYIVLPMLKESFKTIFVLTFTGALKVFDTVYVLTGGGPTHASETMVSYMYNTTFTSRKFGYGTAMGIIEFIIALVVTIIFMRATRKQVDN
jgi:raffinose/stachyose/melibiose transport system permease protein